MAAQIAEAARATDTEPTEAQKEAGNYRKGHVRVDGFDISIEQPKGSVRRGTDADGKQWESEMHDTYGYIRGTEGVDGDHIDVFLSGHPDKGGIYVIDQVDPKTGEFDEHKVMYGYASEDEAKAAYLSNYEKGWRGLGAITAVSREDFKKWIGSSRKKTKPFSEYSMVKKAEASAEPSSEKASSQMFQYFTGTLHELVSQAMKSAQGFAKKVIAPISSRLKNDLEEKGVVVDADYNHVIDNNAIRHAMKKHGGSNEVSRGQIPVTENDFNRIGDVVDNYDNIEVEQGKRKELNIIYSKSYSDGTTIYVEEKRDNRKELAMVTMWKKKSSALTDANRANTTPISDLREAVSTGKDTTPAAEKQETEAENDIDEAKIKAALEALKDTSKPRGMRLAMELSEKELAKARKMARGRKISAQLDAVMELRTHDRADAGHGAERTDAQGNPLNADGTLKLEKVRSVDEITDADFSAPTRSIELPTLPGKVDAAIGADGKPVVIKKNILVRNSERHPDITAGQSRDILKAALYSPDLYGQNQKAKRPYNWVVINTKGEDGKNRLVLLEISPSKDSIEIVHWHYLRDNSLEQIKRQAESEGGLILILPSEKSEEAGGLSSRTLGLSSEGKGSEKISDEKDESVAKYHGYLDGKSKLTATAIDRNLSKLIKIDGEELTIAEHIDGWHKDGSLKVTETKYMPYPNRRTWHRMSNEEQDAWEKAHSEPKTQYWVGGDKGFRDLGKTAHDYAKWLLESEAAEQRTADAEKPLPDSGGKIDDFGEKKHKSGGGSDAPTEAKNAAPVGKGMFGDVYDSFKGKAKEAFDFLASRGNGDLLGVFHREGVGDIDVVWGDKGGGLAHIIDKHIGEGKSFSNIREAAHAIDEIIKTGDADFENGDRIVFKKGSKLVTIRKNIRDKGKKIADKNWVLTAYDELSADGGVSAIAPTNRGQAARTTDKQRGKDSDSGVEPQENGEKTSPSATITDVGEKIKGARKDMLCDYAKSLDDVTVESLIALPFGKVFKRPKLKEAVEKGLLREKDARFAEAVMAAMLSRSKPRLLTGWKKAKSERDISDWAEHAYTGISILRVLLNADEAGRDRLMEASVSAKAYDEESVAQRKKQLEEWNPGMKFEGECYPINPLVLFTEVYERLGYDDFGECKLPVSEVTSSSCFDCYELIGNNGKKVYPSHSLTTFDDVVGEIVYRTKVENADEDTDHPNEVFKVMGNTPITEVTGWRVLTLKKGSYTPQAHNFKTKEEAEKFVQERETAGKGAETSKLVEHKEIVGFKDYEIVFRLDDRTINTGMLFPNKEEAVAATDAEHEKLNGIVNAKLAEERGSKGGQRQKKDYVHIQYYTVDGKTWKYAVTLDERYAPKNTAMNTMPYSLADGFLSRKEAEAYIEEHRKEWDSKIAEINRLRKNFVFFGGEQARVGEDYCKGADVTAEQFREQFGFRGVQFGNWTNQKDRQAALNNAFDSFMDLSKLLGVSPRALSLNGELGIAFGARGTGNAKAHYEPGEVVINLTKTLGAGSLAHEWWHALDNYFARRGNVKLGMVTENRGIAMREELRNAYARLLSDLDASDYNKRSRDFGASYWGSKREETARMFAMWVFDEMSKRGEFNGFLTDNNPMEEEDFARINYDFYTMMLGEDKKPMPFEEFRKTPAALSGYVFPSQAELEVFGADLRRIFDTVQERVDEETGNVALYHKSGGGSSAPTGAEAALRDAVVDRLREGGMDVITDEAEGQRVLDMANGNAKLSAKKRRALETVSVPRDEKHQPTVVSSADGAKVLNELDTTKEKYENQSNRSNTFLGDVAKALGAERHGSASEYATFETKNGRVVTIRLSNHNAKVSNFDNRDETDGISIVVSAKNNNGINNDGSAHIVEYYYNALKLRRAEGKPLADIVRSIKQALYSGEFTDTTGLAERQEVNADDVARHHVRFFRTPDGEAYGFTVGGKIYVDPRIAKADTPLHEYAHLWAAALRNGNAGEWKNVVELMHGTGIWDEVKKRYPELDNDGDIAEEVLAHYSGSRGAERLRAEQQRIVEGDATVLETAAALSALERVKDALRRFWKGVADFLHIHFTTAEEVADRVLRDLLDGVDPRKYGKSAADDAVKYHIVRDKKELERLDKEKTFRMYGAMQERDGKLYSPMAAVIDGKLTDATEIGTWMKADEHPELVDANGKFMLVKTNGKKGTGEGDVPAAYNPYMHTSTSMMNDQFTGAYARGNIKVVEWEIPEYEKTSGYHADKAKDAVGLVPWHSGSVNSLLPKDRQRQVMLSQYRKAVRVVPDAEVAKSIARQLAGTDLAIPWNTVTPNQVKELAKLGVPITTEASGTQSAATKAKFIKQMDELKALYPQAKFVNVKMAKDAYAEWGKGRDANGNAALLRKNGGGVSMRMGDPAETFAERQKAAVENRGVVMLGLVDMAKVNVVDIPRHHYEGNIAQATSQAIKAAKDKYVPNGKPKHLRYDNDGTAFDYIISSNAIDICLSPKHQGKSVNKGVHLALAEHLDEIINNSVEVEEHPDYVKVGGNRNETVNPNALMHRFYGVAVIDGVPCKVMTLMREDNRKGETNGIHSYEVQKIEVLDNKLPSTSNGVGTPSNKSTAYPLAKLLQGVEKAHDKGKKLLEESEKSSKRGRGQAADGFAALPKSERRAAVEREVEAVDAELGTRTVVKGTAELDDAMRSAVERDGGCAYYDPTTGETVVLADKALGAADVRASVVHENIGHKRLDELLGDKAGDFYREAAEHIAAPEELDALRSSLSMEMYGQLKIQNYATGWRVWWGNVWRMLT